MSALMDALGGTLIIEVIEGKLERDTEAFGKMDCYVEIQYRDQIKRTTAHKEGGQLPIWNQKLEFQVESLKDDARILCFDDDNVSRDLVGETIMPISKLTSVEFGFPQWVILHYKGKVAGNIKLCCQYKPPLTEKWPEGKEK